MTMQKTTKGDPILAARVPQKLIKALDRAASKGGRDRSKEIRMRLERSLREQPVLATAAS